MDRVVALGSDAGREQERVPRRGSRAARDGRRVGRRLGALLIDWLLCEAIAVAAFHDPYLTIAVFAVEVYLLTALTGFTVGKRVLGLRVVRLDGKPVGLIWSLVRTLLFLAVVPPLVFDRDLRGLHDKASNTVVIRI